MSTLTPHRARYRAACRRVDDRYRRAVASRDINAVLTALIHATRLWNYADHQRDSDALWAIMGDVCGWSFDDPRDANSHQFTYASPVLLGGTL